MSRITKVEEIAERVVHVHFANQYDAAITFMRLQEFYESPYDDIKGYYFSVEDYMDTYADDTGNFTYTTDWSGYNVPGHVVNRFYSIHDEHSKYEGVALMNKERDLRAELAPYIKKYGDKFYVIGTYKEDTIDHEIAHALYYLHEDVKRTMDKITLDMDHACCYVDVTKALAESGYCEAVLEDEVQAYLATSTYWWLFRYFNVVNFPWLLVSKYRKVFKAAKQKYVTSYEESEIRHDVP